MDRRAFVAGSLLLLASPLVIQGQMGKLPRLGVLWPLSDNDTLAAFRQGLHDLGYVEGENILIEYRYAHGKDDLLPKLVAELIELPTDVILTYGVTAARVATRATTTVPIVNGSMSVTRLRPGSSRVSRSPVEI